MKGQVLKKMDRSLLSICFMRSSSSDSDDNVTLIDILNEQQYFFF